MQSDEQAIRDLVDTWLRATTAGDLPRVLELMDDDVIFTVVGREPFGKEAFVAGFKQSSQHRIEGRSDIKEIKVIGDFAYMRNHLIVTITPLKDGPSIRHAGYVLSIFRKKPDGKWVIFRDANLLTPQASASV